VVLERLSPIERAVFLLREVFDYNYDEIAQMVGKAQPTAVRFGDRVSISRLNAPFSGFPSAAGANYSPFLQASTQGDLQGLMALLAKDVTYWSDGGGQVAAALKPLQGAMKVARFCWRFAANGFRHRLFTSSRLTDSLV